jgi:hypothetical protein
VSPCPRTDVFRTQTAQWVSLWTSSWFCLLSPVSLAGLRTCPSAPFVVTHLGLTFALSLPRHWRQMMLQKGGVKIWYALCSLTKGKQASELFLRRRPRQVYVGEGERPYVEMEKRDDRPVSEPSQEPSAVHHSRLFLCLESRLLMQGLTSSRSLTSSRNACSSLANPRSKKRADAHPPFTIQTRSACLGLSDVSGICNSPTRVATLSVFLSLPSSPFFLARFAFFPRLYHSQTRLNSLPLLSFSVPSPSAPSPS